MLTYYLQPDTCNLIIASLCMAFDTCYVILTTLYLIHMILYTLYRMYDMIPDNWMGVWVVLSEFSV